MENFQIEIPGLTKRQKALCDVLWSLESNDQIVEFVSTLPLQERLDCVVLMNMMLLSALDEVDTVTDEVKDYIDCIRSR